MQTIMHRLSIRCHDSFQEDLLCPCGRRRECWCGGGQVLYIPEWEERISIFLHMFLSLCVFLLMRSIALYFIDHRSIFHLWGESLGEGNGGAGDDSLFRWKWSPLRTDLDQNSPWIFGGSNVFGVAWYCWSGREDQVPPMLLEIYCTLDRWPLTINLIVHLNLVRSVL